MLVRTTMILCFSLLIATPCFASGAGVYNLDKTAMLAKMKKKMAKLPKTKKRFAQMGVAMLKSMTMRMTLKKDGKAEMYAKVVFMGKQREQSATGTWKMEKGKLHLTTTATSKKTKKTKTSKIECTPNGKQLYCVNLSTKRKSELVFIKTK